MTYCVGIRLDAGLVFMSDSRTNAGLDQISTFRKMIDLRAAGRPLHGHAVGRQPDRSRSRCARSCRWRRSTRGDDEPLIDLERHQHVRRRARARQRGAPRLRPGRPVAEGRGHRLQRLDDLRRPDPGRGDAPVPGLFGRQLHRGDARDLLLPDRREQVRQADPRPRADAGDAARRGRQVRAGVDGLDAEVEPVGRACRWTCWSTAKASSQRPAWSASTSRTRTSA